MLTYCSKCKGNTKNVDTKMKKTKYGRFIKMCCMCH